MIAMVNEIIGQVRHIIRGITVDEEHLSVDVVEEVGPGGEFPCHTAHDEAFQRRGLVSDAYGSTEHR
jgi:trimethylamine--corrinoid protein Co-methyltransferase